ncbi:PREDICTED: uncharacterized protein LOC106316849 isoform X1 [Brassica oleracea var. oleracea]|uniref:uncharacterized protein LOC106316849 isoform X1 n=1 Tax=Brassica oleracea var. oleracea TaxID=109376 RepID=UPI0006A6B3AA|nr:PREDICTED: uncharacterized protein LOC106316849 isoform X1 [Brassica oleracea var. oleracea]
MIELLKSHGGLSYGQSPSHFEPKHVPPPIPKKCDWEIEPAELDFPNGAMIRKDSFGEIVKAYWEMRTNSSETYSFISLRRLTDYDGNGGRGDDTPGVTTLPTKIIVGLMENEKEPFTETTTGGPSNKKNLCL